MKKYSLWYLLIITIFFTGFGYQSALAQNAAVYDATVTLYPDKSEITIVDNQVASTQALDVAPYIQDGFTLIPVRGVLEALGAKVNWISAIRQVEVTTADTRIQLTLDSNMAVVNDSNITMDKPVQIINGRTLIPLRFVAENLGYIVKWDGTDKKITIINKTIVSADGISISYGDLDKAIAWAKYLNEKQYGPAIWTQPAGNGNTWGEVFPQIVLNELVVNKIQINAAQSQNTPVEAEINQRVVQYQTLINEDQNLALVVKQHNIALPFLNDLARNSIIGAKYKADYLNKLNISANEMKQYYNDNKSTFANEKVKAAHILIKTVEESTTNDQINNVAAYQKAAAILKRAQAGEDFAKLAQENSEDPGSAANGGNLGYFGKGVMVKEFEQAAFSLGKGQISELVKTNYGYHIIKVDDHTTGTLTYEQAQESIRKILTDHKYQEHLTSLVSQSNIKVYGVE